MDLNRQIERTELHDSSLAEMAFAGDCLRLQFENVWVDDTACYKVTIDLNGVSKILCDGIAVRTVGMKTGDGGVIAFKRFETFADLVVTWTSYDPRADKTNEYRFYFCTVDVRTQPQEEPE